jgi:cytochrome c nitrite reductase small subunit
MAIFEVVKWAVEDLKEKVLGKEGFLTGLVQKVSSLVKKNLLPFLAGIIFAVLCFVLLNTAMKFVSTPKYCGSKCHEMNTAYKSWQLSSHGANEYGIVVDCSDCHLPSKDKYFSRTAVKAYLGMKDLYKHYFGGKYDIEENRKRVAENIPNQRCLNCHNNLLIKPSGSAARIIHKKVLSNQNKPQGRCINCHGKVGHEREKVVSPLSKKPDDPGAKE